ncbi:acetyltransferase [Paraliobacillus quinghaiensis]|uniref:Acetyltransferase n=1 Tax=Paraliobacillus quinghaiensis TaxID=470815 RepID=A0A917TR40_9BACI|nr:GNAT family N-acetyltransferase [Paraliobacillus quinghaiensis]GGM34136.1 acetyltransferase [Paraliobacillus quinghaiensis]
MEWIQKSFKNLTKTELYEIAKLRNEVFVVEQKCNYQDLDDFDQPSTHLFLLNDDTIIAYIRLIPSGHFYKEASLGRVVVKKEYRGKGYGKELISRGMQIMTEEMNEKVIKIQGEAYLKEFYKTFGFKEITEEYIDYGLWHIDMLYHSN